MAFAEEPHTNRTATAKAHEDRDLLATLDWESGGLRHQIPVFATRSCRGFGTVTKTILRQGHHGEKDRAGHQDDGEREPALSAFRRQCRQEGPTLVCELARHAPLRRSNRQGT